MTKSSGENIVHVKNKTKQETRKTFTKYQQREQKTSVEPTITVSPGISVQGWNLKDLFRLGKSSTSRGDNGLHWGSNLMEDEEGQSDCD